MHKPTPILLLISLVLSISSCKKKDLEKEAKLIKRSYEAYLPEVSVVRLEVGDFSKELMSNGTLQAYRKATLKSRTGGRIIKINVSNGEKVTSGFILARLDDTDARINLERRKIEFAQALIEFKDQLITYGRIAMEDTATMNKEALETMKIKSGFTGASVNLKEAEQEVLKTKFAAPFSGRIANLEEKEYNYIEAGSDFCMIIDDSKFEVVFPVIESELGLLQKGQAVQVKPFSLSTSYKGIISEINPLVDENGLVQVKALVQNTDGRLLEGLKVRVIAQQKVQNQLIIPKEALLQRDGRKVVFTLRNDSLAYWNYVQVGLENMDHYTITDGLKEGELIITEGNLNLAHESIVRVSIADIHSGSNHTSF